MGASELLLLPEQLPEHLKDKVEIEGRTCMELCKHNGKDVGQGKAPFVMIDDEIIESATLQSVISKLEEKYA